MPVETATPMLRQYRQIKAKHRDCILFFRLGDFYEMFDEDAQTASGVLDLVLTSRGKGTAHHVPMCGIPYHAADGYIARLIKAGHKVAICEQTEDPSQAKGLVKRDVIRVITSGTYLDEQSQDARYLMAVSPPARKSDLVGIAFIDPSSGTIFTKQLDKLENMPDLLSRLPVFECVYPEDRKDLLQDFLNHPLIKSRQIVLSGHSDWCFNPDIARKNLCAHFGVQHLKGFGIDGLPGAVSSCGALLEYLKQMNHQPVKHVDRITLYSDENYVTISPAAVFGLELDTLFRAINHTRTAMGKRRLRHWLFHPLKNPGPILQRQAAVSLIKDHKDLHDRLDNLFKGLPDVEKCLSKLSCGYVHSRDLLALRQALELIPAIRETIAPVSAKNRLLALDDIPPLRQLLSAAVNPDMPLTKSEGKVIRKGYNAELDGLRDIQENGHTWLKDFQAREVKRTGITTLKVGFNKVFGYYIEISRAKSGQAPDGYIRKQTLVNAERFITQELKTYEEKILSAQDKVLAIEHQLIAELQREILDHSLELHRFCEAVAAIDGLCSLASLARRPGFVAPEVNEGDAIDIQDGRHPVVERTVEGDFVPNDTLLDREENRLIILTGPNMAGKSTYIRQIAVLVILAQIGSYVPAVRARIGVVDKIFTRIGAHDDITKGQSTFMVEMTETADILNNLTDRSLIILDEIGRGTSTFDGLSLAWALAEHLQTTRARTLFATHFHEITALARDRSGIKNYNVAVKEWKDEIIFLHKIVEGSTDDSYGIYVAKLAGVPPDVIRRAKQVLTQLELQSNLKDHLSGRAVQEEQMSMFASAHDPALEEIRSKLSECEIDHLTPLAALNLIQELKSTL